MEKGSSRAGRLARQHMGGIDQNKKRLGGDKKTIGGETAPLFWGE
jgi:hypothetical protein